MAAVGRHRPRGQPADIGMMATRPHPEQHPHALGIEHGCDDRDVGQMGSTAIRIVQHKHIARCNLPRIVRNDGLHAGAHRAQVHRHMRCIGNQRAVCVKHSAGKIQPLLDVDRMGRVLQPITHLLGNRHEQVAEDLQHHRVRIGAQRAPLGTGDMPIEHQITQRREGPAPTCIDQRGRGGLGHDGRSLHGLPGLQGLSPIERRLDPLAFADHTHSCVGLRTARYPHLRLIRIAHRGCQC